MQVKGKVKFVVIDKQSSYMYIQYNTLRHNYVQGKINENVDGKAFNVFTIHMQQTHVLQSYLIFCNFFVNEMQKQKS
jgi:hypothetical protein